MRREYDFDGAGPNPYLARLERCAEVVQCDPEILGGTPVFAGTRVPVRTLFEHLAAGDSADDFLEDFPSVTPEQLNSCIELAGDLLDDALSTPLVEHLFIAARRRIMPSAEAKGYLTDEDIFRDIS